MSSSASEPHSITEFMSGSEGIKEVFGIGGDYSKDSNSDFNFGGGGATP